MTLRREELHKAACVGIDRHLEATNRRLPDAHGLDPRKSGLALHIEGAAGELAVCRFLSLPWPASVNTFGSPDIGERTQVRTRLSPDYDLLLRPSDRDDEIFFHVISRSPRYVIFGWCWGHEGKRQEFLRSHGGRPSAYFVPTSCLRSPHDRPTRARHTDGVLNIHQL